MNKVTLYGLNKDGSYKVWCIHTEDNKVIISHGKEGGKQQTKVDTVEGKNIGRSNETSPSEQAEFEALSRINKQKDKGYREHKKDLQELEIAAMLAHDYLKQGHRIIYPAYIMPKLDGVRALAIREDNKVVLKSRGGKEYAVPHIQEQLLVVMKEGDIWDGEIYFHGKYLEEIVSAVKKTNELTPQLNFIVFDVVNKDTYEYRLIELQRIRRFVIDPDLNVQVCPFAQVDSEDEMKEYHDKYVSEGYEGIMIRNFNGKYESSKRSADLQKFKVFMDEEFEITGVIEDRNGNAVFECFDTTANAKFTVTYGDFEQRKHQLNYPQEYIGKMLTVKYQSRYKDSNLPQFPCGTAIRDYE